MTIIAKHLLGQNLQPFTEMVLSPNDWKFSSVTKNPI